MKKVKKAMKKMKEKMMSPEAGKLMAHLPLGKVGKSAAAIAKKQKDY